MKLTNYIFLSFLCILPLLAQSKPFSSFEENGLFGFKNNAGKVIIKPQYEMAYDFTNQSIAFVVSKSKWVCIDSKNSLLLETFNYDNGPDSFSDKLARFVENKKIGYFDEQCKKVIPANFDFGLPFEKGFAQVCNGCYSKPVGEHSSIVGGKYGIIDKKGKIVLPIEYDAIESIDFKKQIASVTKDKKTLKVNFNN
jgi:hypothetical protein